MSPRAERNADRTVRQVLIVDDHPMMRRALRTIIECEPDLSICDEAADAATAVELARRRQPDAAVIDLRLEAGHGLELIAQLIAQDPDLACLVYTTLDESLYGERAIHAGAMGFLNKREPSAQVVEAIRTVLTGNVYLSAAVTTRMLRRPAAGEGTTPPSAVETLTDRELQVLELIGDGKSTQEIAAQLMISPKTADTHRQRIKRKLDVPDNAALMRVAVEWTVSKG